MAAAKAQKDSKKPAARATGATAAADEEDDDGDGDDDDDVGGESVVQLGVIERTRNAVWLQRRFFPSKLGGRPVRTLARGLCGPSNASRTAAVVIAGVAEPA